MVKFVIIRHGQTEWSNRFTGWTDIDITKEGVVMTKRYAQRLKKNHFVFDLGFTSVLKRGYRTLEIVLKVLGQENIPIIKDWHLNERHYGALQTLSKPETVAKYGKKQVQLWRRSYHVAPPKLDFNDPRHPRFDPLYKDIPLKQLPNGEALKDTYQRTVPYFQKVILPEIKKGKRIILSGHHNSLRSLVKFLDNISDKDIVDVNIPYCIPLIYEFNQKGEAINHYYLASDREVEQMIQSIKNQIKK